VSVFVPLSRLFVKTTQEDMIFELFALHRYSTRVSPQFANRMVEAARSVLNRYIPDIYLYTDVYKGEESGK
jgi:RNA 3'-terminal phosphate cyclase